MVNLIVDKPTEAEGLELLVKVLLMLSINLIYHQFEYKFIYFFSLLQVIWGMISMMLHSTGC